jgi:hypothetical protein
MKREYFNIELKNQSKKRLAALQDGLEKFDGIIHDRHEETWFSGKQVWRNPLLLRVSLPESMRWQFISHTRIWLARPPVIGAFPGMPKEKPIPLRGNHETLGRLRRSYNLNWGDTPWIKDFGKDFDRGNYRMLKGGAVHRVLDGDLELVLDATES